MISTSIDGLEYAEHPLTHLIHCSLEREYERTRARFYAPTDALALMHALISEATRTHQRTRALDLEQASARKRTHTLERAVASMLPVDLDTAWRAALRGDDAVLSARITPHLRRPRASEPQGTPWRRSGFASRRAR